MPARSSAAWLSSAPIPFHVAAGEVHQSFGPVSAEDLRLRVVEVLDHAGALERRLPCALLGLGDDLVAVSQC
jgi:hypothetical protein